MTAAGIGRGEHAGDIAIGKDLVNDCVRYSVPLDLLYLNNPKCACTTVKHALWLASDVLLGKSTFAGNVHDRKADPFAKNVFRLSDSEQEQVSGAVVFSVVRNPFARALSAYVEKVAKDLAVWPIFLKRFGLKEHVGKNELSFADFLALIAVAHDDILDGHFRPQCRNLLLPLAQPVFVGFVENMQAVADFLGERGVPFRDERMNASRASEQLNAFYDARTAALVGKRYADDFVRFGYSTALADARERPGSDHLAMKRDGEDLLLRWLATGEAPKVVTTESRNNFMAFNKARDPEKKLRIVRRTFAHEHNWSRLQRYRKFVTRKSRDRPMAEAIGERMALLRARYVEATCNPDLFVALE
jgi:hypothetical protein